MASLFVAESDFEKLSGQEINVEPGTLPDTYYNRLYRIFRVCQRAERGNESRYGKNISAYLRRKCGK